MAPKNGWGKKTGLGAEQATGGRGAHGASQYNNTNYLPSVETAWGSLGWGQRQRNGNDTGGQQTSESQGRDSRLPVADPPSLGQNPRESKERQEAKDSKGWSWQSRGGGARTWQAEGGRKWPWAWAASRWRPQAGNGGWGWGESRAAGPGKGHLDLGVRYPAPSSASTPHDPPELKSHPAQQPAPPARQAQEWAHPKSHVSAETCLPTPTQGLPAALSPVQYLIS